jgi:hypothetical protein
MQLSWPPWLARELEPDRKVFPDHLSFILHGVPVVAGSLLNYLGSKLGWKKIRLELGWNLGVKPFWIELGWNLRLEHYWRWIGLKFGVESWNVIGVDSFFLPVSFVFFFWGSVLGVGFFWGWPPKQTISRNPNFVRCERVETGEGTEALLCRCSDGGAVAS